MMPWSVSGSVLESAVLDQYSTELLRVERVAADSGSSAPCASQVSSGHSNSGGDQPPGIALGTGAAARS